MKRFHSIRPARVAGVALLAMTLAMQNTAGAADAPTAAWANNAFAASLYRQLGAAEGNLFFSPYSISLAFGMAWGGAGGQTAEQMGRVLQFKGGAAEGARGQRALQDLLHDIQSKGKVQLAVANSIWPEQTYPFRKDYLSFLDRYYRVSVTPCDFLGRPDAERQRINRWVEQHTADRIKDLLPAGSVGADTRLVLANAVYFKGDWASQFKPEATQTAPFHLGTGGTVDASLMTQTESFRYARHDGLQVLALPYAGNDLSMLVILPDAVDGLPGIEQPFVAGELERWTAPLRNAEVTVFLPKFKSTSSFELNRAMTALGMTDAFDARRADFSGMSERRDLFISDAVHKAFIEVNEEGTEAAAATGIVMRVTSMPAPPVVFRADRPFLYLIRHDTTGAILFLGRMTDPTK